jgi:hypothetical protein
MIKKLAPFFIAISGAVVLTLLINKYVARFNTVIDLEKSEASVLAEKINEPSTEKYFEEKRRIGYEDRRKELRDLAMGRPRRKDEMIH